MLSLDYILFVDINMSKLKYLHTFSKWQTEKYWAKFRQRQNKQVMSLIILLIIYLFATTRQTNIYWI